MPCTPVPDDSSVTSISVSVPTQICWGEGSPKPLQNDNACSQVKYVPRVSQSSLPTRLHFLVFVWHRLLIDTLGEPVTNHS